LRATATALTATALTAVVAVAAHHDEWTTGSSAAKRAALWTGAALGLFAVTAGVGLAMTSKGEFGARFRRALLVLAVAAAAVGLAVSGVLLFSTLGSSGGADYGNNHDHVRPIGGGGPPSGGAKGDHGSHRAVPWIAAASGSTLVLLAAAGAVLLARRRRREHPESQPTAAADLVKVLDETVDDLREERDPRRAVIAAYARMERVLGRHGLGRRPSEAPFEYLARVLSSLGSSAGSALRLTDLFEWAKFSHHAIPESMRADAIDALPTLRRELETA
jgi:Domain of unknown function (DUF4129)